MSEPNIVPVPLDLLQALAAEAPAAAPKAGSSPRPSTNGTAKPSANGTAGHNGEFLSRLMVDRWLTDHGRPFRQKDQPDRLGRTTYVLAQCPFDPSHGDPDSCIMQAPDGKLSAQCFHSSCSGRGWQDFKEAIGKPDSNHYDPPRTAKPKQQRLSKTEAKVAAVTTADHHLTDWGNAQRVIAEHGQDLHYCHPWKKWHVWDSRRWQDDATAEVVRRVKETQAGVYLWAAERLTKAASKEEKEQVIALLDHCLKWEQTKAIRDCVELMKSEPGIPILPAQFDVDPLVLNCLNCTVDLRTGEQRPHRREDLLSKMAPVQYDPAATCPLWMACLDTWMAANAALIGYLQRSVGYSLTGLTDEQCMWFFHGPGQNGKTVFLRTCLEISGDYGVTGVDDLLMQKKHQSHPTEKAALFGKRFVMTSEQDQGRKLAEAVMKQLTGGDVVTARRMREDFWDFAPTHKIFLAANHMPEVHGQDFAVWRRIKLVPWSVTIAADKKDPQLQQKLKAEWPGILAWAVRGCLDWQRSGLQEPAEVTAATASYQAEQDTLSEFLRSVCVLQDFARVQSSVLFEAYCKWSCDKITKQKTFTIRLKAKGFSCEPSGGRNFWIGIGLPASDLSEYDR